MDTVIRKWLATNATTAALKNFEESYNKDPDAALWTRILSSTTQWTTFPAFLDRNRKFIPPISFFSQALAGGAGNPPNEFVYLEDGVNSLKGKVSRVALVLGKQKS